MLEETEHVFNRAAGVRVRRGDYDAQLFGGVELLHELTRVVRRAIQKPNCVGAPAWQFLVEQLHQLDDENDHDVSVGGGLAHRIPEVTVSADGDEQRDSRRQSLLWF